MSAGTSNQAREILRAFAGRHVRLPHVIDADGAVVGGWVDADGALTWQVDVQWIFVIHPSAPTTSRGYYGNTSVDRVGDRFFPIEMARLLEPCEVPQ